MNTHSHIRPTAIKSVHIVLSDRGWILERLAREIADRLPYVGYGLDPDPSAPIQYYVTYGCRRQRVSPIEIALFTHREEDAKAGARFDAVAGEVDHAVAMSSGTHRLIEALGIAGSSCITPGVDLDIFRPRLKIAVVGRTYHTGRKGEALVRAVMDVPDIEWHFTGTGWPGPAEHVADADLPAFYRSMDYILVPALNEGGPMSVLEALASGVQVIASTVGWVPDFPHIAFERGNAESLREVLMAVREQRMALRASVEHMTWDRWASGHDALFQRLLADPGISLQSAQTSAMMRRVRSVALVTHGDEDTTLGGPSVRVPGTAKALGRLNLAARALHNRGAFMAEADIVHGFNVWLPRTAVAVAREARRLGKPTVFSPILLDLSEGPLWRADVLRVFRRAKTPAEADIMMQRYVQIHQERLALLPSAEPEPGYRDTVAEIAGLSDALIFLSEHERTAFTALVGETGTPGYLIRNPVDTAHFSSADLDLFRSTYGLTDYVVCVARIEPRKNQLMLVSALQGTGITLVLIGHQAHSEYLSLIRRFGGPNLIIIDRLEPGSEMLRSAIAGARVFVLPSWAEGAPLAALEAAAAGTKLVLSDRSGEREYFGDRALYCDPASMASIRRAVLEAWETPLSREESRALSDHIAETFSWDNHARETLAVYEDVLALRASRPMAFPQPVRSASREVRQTPRQVVLDVTTWANHASTLSGIVRVERSIALDLISREDVSARFVMYLSVSGGFFEVPREIIIHDVLKNYVAQLKSQTKTARSNLRIAGGGDLIAVGSSWMQNAEYSPELTQLARDNGLILSVLMHDMTPALFPHWYASGYSAVWEQNCAAVIARADRLLVYSESTRRDVTAFAEDHGIDISSICKIRLADEIGVLESEASQEGEKVRGIFGKRPFVLSVGAIHVRKNYGLLYDVWLILRETMGDACPQLVIVGGVSWNGAETARMIREDPRVNKYIHILENIDDSTLGWLYDHAILTAYPSLYEGWGLPVGESLAHGRICLSSDSSSMREIAPDLTDLIDPFDRVRWAAMVRHYATSASARRQREEQIRAKFAITSWRKTTNDLVAALDSETPARQPRCYNLGEIALVSRGESGGAYLGSGWFQREEWGCWSKSESAGIDLTLVHEPSEDLVLTVLAKVLKPIADARRYTVRVNGSLSGTWHFPRRIEAGVQGQNILVNRVIIPGELARSAKSLDIRFETDQLCAVSEAMPGSTDPRHMGIGLVAFMIERQSAISDVAVLLSTRNDVRAALGAGPAVDVPTALTKSAHRPSVSPDVWIKDLTPFARIGTHRPSTGIDAASGCVTLALGLARMWFDRPARVEFIVDAPQAKRDHPTTIVVFVNDIWTQAIVLNSAEPRLCAVDLSVRTLAASDPLTISFLSSGVHVGGKPAFSIAGLRLAQDVLLPSERRVLLEADHPVKISASRKMSLTQLLPQGWYDAEAEGVWSIGSTGRIRLSTAADEAGSMVLALRVSRISSGLDNDLVSLVSDDGTVMAAIPFPAGKAGKAQAPRTILLALPPSEDRETIVDAGLKAGNPAWPGLFGDHPEKRRLGVRLLSLAAYRLEPLPLDRPVQLGTEADGHVLLVDGWHDREGDGCWGAGDRVSLAFRIDAGQAAATPVLHCSVLRPDAQPMTIRIIIDGQEQPELIAVPDEVAGITISLPAARSDGCHIVELAGLAAVSPASLGQNDDKRPLSLRLMAVSLAPDQVAVLEREDEHENERADASEDDSETSDARVIVMQPEQPASRPQEAFKRSRAANGAGGRSAMS